MKVNAWTCALATASDLESAQRSIKYQDPKDCELCLRRAKRQGKLRWSSDTDVQIVRFSLEKGAKDKPNHLTAGSLRCFPQDNWN